MTQNYSNGKIYLLRPSIPNYDLGDVYIGSTTMSLEKRFSNHCCASNHTSAKFLFQKYGAENITIELLENYPCELRSELQMREGQHIRSRKCINKSIAGRTPKQYYADNRSKLIKQNREWAINNKPAYNAYMKNYMRHYRLKKKLENTYSTEIQAIA
jgi:hypothetical protein